MPKTPPRGYRPSLFSDYIRPDDILHGLGPAEYNGTHLVYTPGEWAPISPIPALYTYTIRDGMNRSASANVTIHITNPVARAVVSDVESDPKFFVIGYHNDPISGRILDDDGNIIYNFTGIRSGSVGRDIYYNGQEYDLVPDVGLYAWAYRFPILLSYPVITAVVPGFDPPLEPGTYTYQFARTADADYAGDDVHAGTFTVPEPSEHAPKVVNRDPSNRDPVALPIERSVALDNVGAFQLPVYDPDGDDLTITRIYGNTLGTAFDVYPQLGRIVYAAGNTLGTDTFYYTVSDGRGGSATGTVTIGMWIGYNYWAGSSRSPEQPDAPPKQTPNRPPVAPDMQITVTPPFFPTYVRPPVTDPDGDEVTITNVTGATLGTASNYLISWSPSIRTPSGQIEYIHSQAELRPSGQIEYIPSQVGTDRVTYTVSDGYGGTDTGTITIYVGEQNDPMPVPDVITDMDVLEAYMPHGLVAYAGVLEDRGNTTGTMQTGAARQAGHDAAPGLLLAGLIIDATDSAWIADRDIAGQDDITVSVSETGNVPPVLSEMGHYTINAHDTLAFRVPATDYGGGTISYLLSGAPGGATISGQGVFSWTPESADVDIHTFAIAAYDRYGAATTEDVRVRVLPAGTPNEPPAAPDVAAAVAPGARITIVPAIYDPDGDPARITRVTADAGGSIMPSDNSIEYTAGPAPGIETVTYTVRDSRGASDTGTITITIQ